MAIAAAAILWFGRGTTFWIDDVVLVLQSPHLSLRDALQAHDGHFVLTSRLVDKWMLGIFGVDYLPFRVLNVAMVLTTVGLLYAWGRKRVPPLVALAPCLVLLFFGSDYLHALGWDGFAVLLPLATGLGALLALERDRTADRILACGLLCLGVVTYSIALAFVLAIAVWLLAGDRRPARLWVVAVPVAIYGAWWLWTLTSAESGPGNSVGFTHLLLLPAWGFQSLSAVADALSGLSYDFGDAAPGISPAGAILAALGILGVGWRISRGSVSPGLWAALALLLGLWALQVVASAEPNRFPDSSRYLFPGAIATLMVAFEAAAGLKFARPGLLGIYLLAGAGLATNLFVLHQEGEAMRNLYAAQLHAGLGALEIVSPHAKPNFEVPPVAESVIEGGQSPLSFPEGKLSAEGASFTAAYSEAARRYGSLGYTPSELTGASESLRTQADAVMVAALGVRLSPVSGAAMSNCRVLRSPAGEVSARLPAGGAVLRARLGVPVGVRRFATSTFTPVGQLHSRSPAALDIPADAVKRPWKVQVETGVLTLCQRR